MSKIWAIKEKVSNMSGKEALVTVNAYGVAFLALFPTKEDATHVHKLLGGITRETTEVTTMDLGLLEVCDD